jgi:hypothetical protein
LHQAFWHVQKRLPRAVGTRSRSTKQLAPLRTSAQNGMHVRHAKRRRRLPAGCQRAPKNVLPESDALCSHRKTPSAACPATPALGRTAQHSGPECILACVSASASQRRTPKQRRCDERSADAKMHGCSGAKAAMQAQ